MDRVHTNLRDVVEQHPPTMESHLRGLGWHVRPLGIIGWACFSFLFVFCGATGTLDPRCALGRLRRRTTFPVRSCVPLHSVPAMWSEPNAAQRRWSGNE